MGYRPFIGQKADGTADNSTEGLFRHIDHFVQLVGPDHVGLGLDYVFDIEEAIAYYRAHPERFPASAGYSGADQISMIEPERLPTVVQTMIDHEYPAESIRLILGANHLRIAEACWGDDGVIFCRQTFGVRVEPGVVLSGRGDSLDPFHRQLEVRR